MFTLDADLNLIGLGQLERSLVDDVLTLSFNQRPMVRMEYQPKTRKRKVPAFSLTVFDNTNRKAKPIWKRDVNVNTGRQAFMRLLICMYRQQVQDYTIMRLKSL